MQPAATTLDLAQWPDEGPVAPLAGAAGGAALLPAATHGSSCLWYFL